MNNPYIFDVAALLSGHSCVHDGAPCDPVACHCVCLFCRLARIDETERESEGYTDHSRVIERETH